MKINLPATHISGRTEASNTLAQWISAVYKDATPSPVEGRFTKQEVYGVGSDDISYITTLFNNFRIIGTFTYAATPTGGIIAAAAWPELQRGQS